MRTLENKKPDNHSSSPFFGPKIQKKLTTGTVGDKYEVEADTVADKVVNKQKGGGLLQSKAEESVQRKPISETISTVQKQDLEKEKPVQKKGKEKEEDKKKVQKKTAKEEDKKIQKKGKEKEDDKKKIQKKADKDEDKKVQKKGKEKEDDKKKIQKKADKDEDKKIQKKGKEKEEDKKKPVQKKSNNNESTANDAKLENNLKSSKGGGSPLSKGVKSEMESGFGTDFSQVRIHTDSNAMQMSQDLGAQAFTNGNDIYFNSGKYDADSKQGKHLLAHELTHTVQQGSTVQKKENTPVQRSWLGDAWDSATDTVSDGWDAATGAVSETVSGFASDVSAAWDSATSYLGEQVTAVWEGMKSLGSDALNWLSGAASYVWDGIKWFGNKAWDIIKVIGTVLWEKLCLLGNNVWSFISNIPSRLWRLIVHGWDAITGILGWAWDGLSAAAGHLWEGVKGVFSWLGSGISGAANWILQGVVAGYDWAVDFVTAPSLSKLWNALTGTLSWLGKGISGFAQWGWNGIVGAAVWAWQGIKGFASWIWDGILGGLTWTGKLLLYLIDLLGIFEILQLIWGLIFRMRKLTDVERNASLQVHPAGMIPYDQVYVDEGSLVAYISGYFSGGGYRAVTTAHIIHAAPGEDTATMVHELSHVAQYEHAGSVYMAQAIHAQAFGEGYNYINSDGTFKHAHFNEFNREQQASICEDYYKALNGGGGHASAAALLPFVNEMRAGKF